MIEWFQQIILNSFSDWYIPGVDFIDVIEILIIAAFVYYTLLWIKNTKAWMLLKGLIALGAFILLAYLFRMHTIFYIARASINVLAIGAIVVFQPELRRALEKLGEKNLLSTFNPFDRSRNDLRFSDATRKAIVDAVIAMAAVKTGALIVVEQAIHITEYEMTGIALDSLVSKQILLNIFENKTPLHDGAVIIRGNRIASATSYLPLSSSMQLSKDLGTRHRAALGISEVSDVLVIVVSEESGRISLAYQGRLYRNPSIDEMERFLKEIQVKHTEVKKFSFWKGRHKNEKV